MITRRGVLHGTAAATIVAAAPCTAQALNDMPVTLAEAANRFAPLHPQFAIALELLVEVGEPIEGGQGPLGRRRIVPITGGQFRGRGLSGRVLPGGADRQTIRADAIRELDATYELEADDGTILMVRNRVIVDDQRAPPGESRYARSVVTVAAPAGAHEWLNRRILLGTLNSLRPQVPQVFLRFFVVE
jgi:hypothetical protein